MRGQRPSNRHRNLDRLDQKPALVQLRQCISHYATVITDFVLRVKNDASFPDLILKLRFTKAIHGGGV